MGLETPLFELLGQLVARFFWPFAILVAALTAIAVELLLIAIVRLVRGRRSTQPNQAPAPSVLRSLLYGTLGLTIAALIGAAVLSTVLLGSTLRFVGTRVAASKGVELSFESAAGNLWLGRIELRKLHVRRTTMAAPLHFDLRVDNLRFEFSILDLLRRRLLVTQLRIRGVSGTVNRRGRGDDSAPARPRTLVVRDLQLERANLSYRDIAREATLSLILRQASCVRVRHEYLLFDLFFDCNARGQLDGAELEVRRRGANPGLDLTRLPAKTLVSFFPAPFRWLRRGSVTLRTRRELLDEASGRLKLHTTLTFEGMRMAAPPKEAMIKRALMMPIVAAFNRRPHDRSMTLALTVDRETWRNASTFERTGLLAALGRTLMLSLRVGGSK